MNVFIAGGAHSMVFGNFQRNLNSIGIQVVGHAPMESKTYNGIPVGADGVIILKDMISHELSGKVVADAKARGLIYALVERKWAKAQAALMKMGFIKAGTTRDIPVTHTTATAKVMDTKPVSDFILETHNSSGRIATLSEIRQRFPEVSTEDYNAACKIAVDNGIATKVVSDKDVASYITEVLRDDYSLVRDEAALTQRVQETFPDIATFVTPKQIKDVTLYTTSTWRRYPGTRERAIYSFALSRYRQFKKDGTGWISFGDLDRIVKPIFGVGGNWNNFCRARAEVFGAWAFKTEMLKNVLEDYNKQNPQGPTISEADARMEMAKGSLKGFMIGGHYRTSVAAIVDYVKNLDQDSNKPKVPEDTTVAKPPAVPAPTPAFDSVGLAELIESGVKIQLSQHMTKLEACIGENSRKNAEVLETMKQDAETRLSNAISIIHGLSDVVRILSDDIRRLQDQMAAVKSNTNATEAQNLGSTLLNAKGAEVRLIFGECKG